MGLPGRAGTVRAGYDLPDHLHDQERPTTVVDRFGDYRGGLAGLLVFLAEDQTGRRLAGSPQPRGMSMPRLLIEFKPRALKDLKALETQNRARLLKNIERLKDNLRGDVKRLTDFTPEYRLRVGDYRVLFEVEEDPSGNLQNKAQEKRLRLTL